MFTQRLLTWYDEHKRSLPWRGETDPYKIWVSEIILQQTRVQQGWDYYLLFIETFPTVESLAKAQEEQVLRVWQGLGYYSRARNMHTAAQQIVELHQGIFPQQYDDIRKLKGIGDYTAAAIGSIAFGLPYPAVDGNVLRIISRIFGIFDDIATQKTRQKITDICTKIIDTQRPGDFNQACMEFGATWCTPKNPQCTECPFFNQCYALQHGQVNTLPIKSNKISKRERYFVYTIYIYSNNTLLEQRTGKDIWKNLYQFPLLETDQQQYEQIENYEYQLREVLTHQIVHAKFIVETQCQSLKATNNQIIVPISALNDYPMPKIMTEFLKSKDLYEQK